MRLSLADFSIKARLTVHYRRISSFPRLIRHWLSLDPILTVYESDSVSVYLGDIVNKLDVEDPVTRVLRRALGFMDILNKVHPIAVTILIQEKKKLIYISITCRT